MHCELGNVLIYPDICTLIYSDFPSVANEGGEGTAGAADDDGDVFDGRAPDFIRQKKLRREPADDRKDGDDSVLIDTPVLISIKRSRGP